MKAKQADKLMALRAVKSELLLAKTADGATGDIAETTELKILTKLVKQRKDSATIYKEQGREDLYEKEVAEAGYIEVFLPQQLSDEEIEAAIKVIISQVGATSMKDMGKVMGLASKQMAGKADGKTISTKVRQILA